MFDTGMDVSPGDVRMLLRECPDVPVDQSCVVYGDRVSLAIVSACHLYLRTSLLYRQRYIVVSLSPDKCTYCKSLG